MQQQCCVWIPTYYKDHGVIEHITMNDTHKYPHSPTNQQSNQNCFSQSTLEHYQHGPHQNYGDYGDRQKVKQSCGPLSAKVERSSGVTSTKGHLCHLFTHFTTQYMTVQHFRYHNQNIIPKRSEQLCRPSIQQPVENGHCY